jgi:cytochrome c oxidase subunit 2
MLFGGVGVAGVAYGTRRWLPELASKHGVGIDAMLLYLLVTVGGLFLIGHLVLAYFIWSGSRREQIGARLASRRTERALSTTLGLAMAVVAEGGVLAIGIPVWAEYFQAAPPADAVLVEVTAQQFMWNVRYPGADGAFGRTEPRLIDDATNPIGLVRSDPAARDDIVTINELTVPVDRAVRIRLRSKDVIHSFFLPHFRVKQDAVPGMSPEVVFVPTRTGTFELACAELCGLAHYRMRGFVAVVTAQDYDGWLRQQAATMTN